MNAKKAYALYACSRKGFSSILAIVPAENDPEVAEKLGGKLVEPNMSTDEMSIYSMGFPQLGEGWSRFEFGNEDVTAKAAMRELSRVTGLPTKETNLAFSVENLATNADCLIIARVPLLMEE